MAVITVSRQYGSGGDEIAAQVCEALGCRSFDKRLMAQVASDIGLSDQEIVDFSEDEYKVRGFLERLFRTQRVVARVGTWTTDVSGTRTRAVKDLDEAQAVNLVRALVRRAAEEGNVLIVGRGGQAILQDVPGVLHVRIEAPTEIRIKRVQEAEGLTYDEARGRIIESDRAARDYLRRFYDVDWADPQLYDLVINTRKISLEAAAEHIIKAVAETALVSAPVS
jgi:cytidylate kinase